MIESRRARSKRASGIDQHEIAALESSLMSLHGAPNVVVLVDRVRRSTVRALGYGAGLKARRLSGVHVVVNARAAAKLTEQWDRRCPGVMLTLVDAGGCSTAEALRRLAESETATGSALVVILPEHSRSLRAVFGLADPSYEIVEALQDVPNAWVVLPPV